MEKVTIVTVTYNCASVLERTIKSVINQTYGDIEYVVIDGGSKDGTIDVIRRYESQITYWKSEPDKGIYDAMNKGIAKATGQWINFMNAGDFFCDNNVISSVFQKHIPDSVGFIYGKNKSITEDGIKEDGKPVTFMEQKGKYRNMAANHQAIFVRTSLARLYPFDLTFKLCADYNMIMTIWKAGYKGLYADLYVSTTEQREGASANNRNVQRLEEARVCGCDRDFTFLVYHCYKMLRAWIKHSILKIK